MLEGHGECTVSQALSLEPITTRLPGPSETVPGMVLAGQIPRSVYVYVSDNPVTNADPSGRFKIDQSCKKPQCRTFGSAGQQDLEQVLQQQADFACQNLQRITDPKLRACIQKSCDKGTIKWKDNTEKGCKDAGGYNSKFPFITNRTANLCPGNWPDCTPLSYVGDAVIHEFAHGCGWEHGQGGGVPIDPGRENE